MTNAKSTSIRVNPRCVFCYFIRSPLTTSTSSLRLTTNGVRRPSIHRATSDNLPQEPAATTAKDKHEQDDKPSLTARKVPASREASRSNAEGLAPPPNTATGGDLVNEGHQLRRLPKGGPAMPPVDNVHVELSGDDGRHRDGVGGNRDSQIPPPTGPMVAGECAKLGAAQISPAVDMIRTARRRLSPAEKDYAQLVHNAENSNPLLSPANPPTTPPTALEPSFLGAIVPPPSSQGESRKRARGVKEKAQEERRPRKDGPKLPARRHRRPDGESGRRQMYPTRCRVSAVVVDSKSGSGGGGGDGGSVGQGGRYATAVLNGEEMRGSDPREDVGQEKRVTRRHGEEGDAYSTIMWYKTIAACLMAAAS